jgi:hypothetical protein
MTPDAALISPVGQALVASPAAAGRASRPGVSQTRAEPQSPTHPPPVSSDAHLEVHLDPQFGIIVRVVNASGEMIRQVPAEEVIAIARRLGETLALLLDRKA